MNTIFRKDYDDDDWVIFNFKESEVIDDSLYVIGQILECKSDVYSKGSVLSFEIDDHVKVVKYDDKTEQQTSVIQFLIEQAIESDSRELDLWLAYLARQAGDEQLAIAIEGGEYDAN